MANIPQANSDQVFVIARLKAVTALGYRCRRYPEQPLLPGWFIIYNNLKVGGKELILMVGEQFR